MMNITNIFYEEEEMQDILMKFYFNEKKYNKNSPD